MKLLKKLLPIASVAGAAAIVTPLVTSCGYKTFKYDIEKIISGDYEWVDQKEGSLSESDATKTYLKDVNKNKKILADDIVYALIGMKNDKTDFTIEIGVGKMNVNDERITFKLIEKSLSSDKKGSLSVEYKNIPVKVSYGLETEISSWWIKQTFKSYENLKDDKEWKINIKFTGDLSEDMGDEKYDYNSSDEDLKEAFSEYLDMVDIPLYYLGKTTCSDK